MSTQALRAAAIALALVAATPVLAQDETDTATEGTDTAVVTTEDEGFDLGWLGLLGLAGLAGLAGRRRDTRTVHTTTTPR